MNYTPQRPNKAQPKNWQVALGMVLGLTAQFFLGTLLLFPLVIAFFSYVFLRRRVRRPLFLESQKLAVSILVGHALWLCWGEISHTAWSWAGIDVLWMLGGAVLLFRKFNSPQIKLISVSLCFLQMGMGLAQLRDLPGDHFPEDRLLIAHLFLRTCFLLAMVYSLMAKPKNTPLGRPVIR